ncbi:MAG: PAS domain S-box protein, partial [Chlorobiaceae bacterium]
MAKKQHTKKYEHLSQLRTKAEERLQQQKISTLYSDLINQDSSEEMIRLIHELEVLHVALEIQQEELAVTRIDLEESLSKQKHTEDALRKSEHNFRSITEQMGDEVFVIDFSGTLTYVSPVVEKLFGYLPYEVIGHPFTDYILEEDVPGALQLFNNTQQNKTENHVFEFKLKRKDSSLFDGEIHMQYYQDQEISGMIGLIRDVSDRKNHERIRQAYEQKILESKEHFEATIDAAKIGTWDWNVQTGKVICNNRWFEIVGYSPEELSPESIQTSINLAHPDDFKESRTIAEQHFRGELPYYEIEYRMKHKNGHWVWFL